MKPRTCSGAGSFFFFETFWPGGGAGWQVAWSDEPEPVPGKKVSKKREVPPLHVLGFTLDEIKEARLAPIVDFKGRKRAGVQE